MESDDPPPYSAACQITGFHPPTPSAPQPDGNTQATSTPSNVGYRPATNAPYGPPGGPEISNEPPFNESSSKYFDNQHRQTGVPPGSNASATNTNVAPPQGYVAPSHVVYQPQEGTAMVMPTHQQIHGPIHGTIQIGGMDASSKEEWIERESTKALVLSCITIFCCPLGCMIGIIACIYAGLGRGDSDQERAIQRINASKRLSIIALIISSIVTVFVLLGVLLPIMIN